MRPAGACGYGINRAYLRLSDGLECPHRRMLKWDCNRRWRMILWLMVGIGLLLFILLAWDSVRWRRGETESGGTQWRRGNVIRIDENRDGIIEEISTRLDEKRWRVRRDTDGDGVLDLEYELTDGIARHLRPIL